MHYIRVMQPTCTERKNLYNNKFCMLLYSLHSLYFSIITCKKHYQNEIRFANILTSKSMVLSLLTKLSVESICIFFSLRFIIIIQRAVAACMISYENRHRPIYFQNLNVRLGTSE